MGPMHSHPAPISRRRLLQLGAAASAAVRVPVRLHAWVTHEGSILPGQTIDITDNAVQGVSVTSKSVSTSSANRQRDGLQEDDGTTTIVNAAAEFAMCL